jgi:hypothetical protein
MSSNHGEPRSHQPFPVIRPDIELQAGRVEAFAVDCRETPGWFALPDVGDATLWSIYDPPDRRLTSVTEMVGTRPARIHDLECVEIQVNDWEPSAGWQPGTWAMFARATADRAEWLAQFRVLRGKRVLTTFLDEGFEADWGSTPRHIADEGRLVPNPDGTYRLKASPMPAVHDVFGAGVFRVRIGDLKFPCLRVLSVSGEPRESGILYVSYITQDGRTVLGRRFNGRHWGRDLARQDGGKPPWDERLPDHERMVIDGVVYVHWYDCLSHLACGIDPGNWRKGSAE